MRCLQMREGWLKVLMGRGGDRFALEGRAWLGSQQRRAVRCDFEHPEGPSGGCIQP